MGDGKKAPWSLGGKRVKLGFEFGTSNQGEVKTQRTLNTSKESWSTYDKWKSNDDSHFICQFC